MSEPMVKQRPTADLDDFERRLRQAPSGQGGDPLAELARLVGEQYDPFDDVFAQDQRAAHPEHAPAYDPRREPAMQASSEQHRLFGDFAAIEAGLRGGVGPHAEPPAAAALGVAEASHNFYDETNDAFGHPVMDDNWHERSLPEPAPTPSRRPVLAVAATIAIGVLGIGAAFALKGHVSSSPREIRTIMADAGPTKVQPPADSNADAAGSDTNVIGKGGQPTPTALVNREEQPVDVAQAVQDNAARAVQSAPAAAVDTTDASTVPVPPSPGQVRTALADPQNGSGQGDPIGDQVQKFGLGDMPAPKHVKVVSVRPDGTIMSSAAPTAASENAAPRQAPAKTSDKLGPVAKPAAPKAVTAKTTSRVAGAPKSADKSIESIANGDDDQSAPARKAKPQRLAAAEIGQAEASHAETPVASSGGFAVQLAAPGSEADAKAATSRLGRKFASALAGHRLGFHKAESNGRSVYRVRVGSLSRSEAVSLCEKLKGEGGSCFVARD